MDRIEGEEIEIDYKKVKDFWDKRADKYTRENPYSSVKLRENKNNELEMWDEYEKEIIINHLSIDENSTIIDIGCGVGRISKHMIPVCKYYLGVDYSQNLIDLAKDNIHVKGNYDFIVCNASQIDLQTLELSELPTKFNKVLIIGCLQYLNDNDVEKLIRNILSIVDNDCDIYITNSESKIKRLTLNEFNSEMLGKYSSIYRTHNENLRLYQPLFDKGFSIITHQPMSISERYSETIHTYTIMKLKK